MIIVRNLRNVEMAMRASQKPLAFKAASPFAKLLSRVPADTKNIQEIAEALNNDEQFENLMEMLVNELKPIMTSRIAYIRNEIGGAVAELADAVADDMDVAPPAYAPYTIVTNRIPEILTSEFLVAYTNPFKEVQLVTFSIPSEAFPPYSAGELIDKMCFIKGDEEFNSMVADLADACGTSIVDIYNKHFRNITTPDYPQAFKLVAPSYINFMYIENTVVFLLANAFAQDIDPNVNMRAADYSLAMANLIGNVGRYLNRVLPQLLNTFGPKGNLYLGTQSTKLSNGMLQRTIVLNAERYANALENGLKPSEVMGMGIKGSLSMLNNYGTPDCTRAREDGEKAFNLAQSRQATLAQDQLKTNAINSIMTHARELIAKNKFAVQGKSDNEILLDCREVLDQYSALSLDQVPFMCRAVVCKALYPNSGAFSYFTAMDNYQKANPNITPREAATLAARDAIVEYSLNQLV